jgi:peptide deformylase
MALLPIIVAPDRRLKVKSTRVERVDDDMRALMDDMLETMYDAPGIGLAAPQVGVTKRIIVLDLARPDEDPQPYFMANPEVIWTSDETGPYEEGCLSLPEYYAEVIRPVAARIRYLDRENEIRELDTEDMLAKCVQHEIDHLDGVLFVDHISIVKRSMILRKLAKAKRSDSKVSA